MLPQPPIASGSHDRFNPGVDRKARGKVMVRRLLRVAMAAGIVTSVGVVVLLPVRFPSAVSTFGTITTAHKWVLATGTNGQLIASTFNYRTGLSEGYRVSSFNAGSSVYFSLHPSIVPGRHVAIGDTVGSLYSSEMQERLIALNGQLATAQGLLAVDASGEKSAIVNAAQQRLTFAQRRRTEHKSVMERTQKLFEDHVISLGEYELVMIQANTLEDEIGIAEANLEAAQTGAKPEQLQLVHANIAALKSEIAAIQSRAGTYTLTAPISGIVTPTFSGDTLVTIADNASYIALIPVKSTDYERVAATPDARLTLKGMTKSVRGNVVALNREVQVLHGQRVSIATAVLENPGSDVMQGMLAPCRIQCRSVTATEYARKLMQSLVASSLGTWSL